MVAMKSLHPIRRKLGVSLRAELRLHDPVPPFHVLDCLTDDYLCVKTATA